jgi:hypothetical protein
VTDISNTEEKFIILNSVKEILISIPGVCVRFLDKVWSLHGIQLTMNLFLLFDWPLLVPVEIVDKA